MSKRFLNRAFSQAQFRDRRDHHKPKRTSSTQRTIPVVETEPTDAIDRIIKAFDDNDMFKVMKLPLPDVDDLGQPVWPYDVGFITKKYRQLSLLVHPDKNSGERARHAFQLLNRAYQTLMDEEKRKAALRSACATALKEKEKREACATVDEKIKINAEKIKHKRKLAKIESESFNSEILRQVKERQTSRSIKRNKIATTSNTTKEVSESDPAMEEQLVEEERDEVFAASWEGDYAVQKRKSVREKVRDKLKNTKPTPEDKQQDDKVDEDEDEWEIPQEKKLVYKCKTCSYEAEIEAESYCVYVNEVRHSAKEKTQVLRDVRSDPTLPRTHDVRCPACEHAEAVYFSTTTPDGMTLFFNCTSCGHKWQEDV